MIVYGDHRRTVSADALLAEVRDRLDRARGMGPGLERHAVLVGALIALGELAQGVADREDARTAAGSAIDDQLAAALLDMASGVLRSWDSGFADAGRLPDLPDLAIASPLTVRLPEGFAFYALYPETMAIAARTLVLAAQPRVIGIRSIGTTLGAIAAAALGAPPAISVRPTGHPFNRQLVIPDDIAAPLLAGEAHYVIVDEGPGLSGSSFAAVARWLRDRGVPVERIAFLPSHDGEPGGQASDAVRAAWRGVQRRSHPADAFLTGERVRSWIEPLIGPLDASPEDLSGGRWRAVRDPDEARWPAVQPSSERLKWRVTRGGADWLVKFVGLGDTGERTLAAAQHLAAAGWGPSVTGMTHGLLVQRWRPGHPVDRSDARLPAQIGRYLAARARLALPPPECSAAATALADMAVHNSALALGADAAARLRARLTLPDHQATLRPIDGSMGPWEWIATDDGQLLKLDALDCGRSHDLVGSQPLEWDVAGAIIEFGFDQPAMSSLLGSLACAGVCIDQAWLDFLLPCYVAFRIGVVTLAADTLTNWPEEARRNRDAAMSYASRLSWWITSGCWTADP